MDLKNSEVLADWDKWKETLAKTANLGQAVGMSDETISRIGTKIGNFLSAVIEPENPQQRLLQELWKVGDDEDRRVLSKMIVKMVQADDK